MSGAERATEFDLDLDAATRRDARRTLVVLLGGVVAVFANIYTTQPVLPILSEEFAVAPAVAGLSISAVVICIALAAGLYGWLADRFGRKPVIVWSSGLLVLPTFAAALAGNFAVLLLCRLCQGLLIPGTTVVAIALVQEELPPAWRGAATGAWVSATTIGGMSGRLLGGFAAGAPTGGSGGWRWAFLIAAGTTALAWAAMLRWLPGGWRVTPRHALPATGAPSPNFWRDRHILGAALIGGAFFFAFTALFTYLPFRLAAPPFLLGSGAIGSLYLVYLVGAVAAPATGRLSDTIGRRATLAASLLVLTAGIALTAIPTLGATIVALLIVSGGLFAAQTAATALVGDHASTARASAAAFYLRCYYLGATLAPPLGGLVWQWGGWGGLLALTLTALVGALALVGMVG